VLEAIGELIADSGISLTALGLPEPRNRPTEVIQEQEAFRGRQLELQQDSERMHQQMTEEQRFIFDRVVAEIVHKQCSDSIFPLFIEGKPGRGKTFLVDTLCSFLRSKDLFVLVCGSSALSATLYERGRTAHKLFGIPVNEVCVSLLIFYHLLISLLYLPIGIS
jgi:PIF1-like helicase